MPEPSDGTNPKARTTRYGAAATNWDMLRNAGQQSQEVLLAAFSPEEIRRLRGPALRKRGREKTSPLIDPKEPLRILFGPDLDPGDGVVRLLANLGHFPQIRIYADPDLAARLRPIKTEPWSVEKKEHYILGRWGSGPDEEEAGLSFQPFISMEVAAHVLGDDFQKLAGPLLARYAEAIQFQQSSEGPMHLMATRCSNAISLRAQRTGLWSCGFVSPEEALLIALLVQHHYDRFWSLIEPGFTETTEAFGWYSGLAQLALPRYLPLFSRHVDKLERRGYVGGRLFDTFQGIFKRVRQVLRIHDQLAWLQLVESKDGSNLRLTLRQSELVFEGVSAIKSALDGLAVMLVTKAQVQIDPEHERVVFADIRSEGKPWSKQFGRYQPVIAAIEPNTSKLLDVALELRRLGTHYHPLDDVRLNFSQWIQGVNQDGTTRWVPINTETAGAIRLAQRRETSDLPYGEDGLLPFEWETYALPWPFVRGLARDTIHLVSTLLDHIASVDGVSEDKPTSYFRTTSPYAQFELGLHRGVSIGSKDSLSGIVPA